MSTELIVFIVVLVLLLATLPTWPHSRRWGWGPSSMFLVAIILVLLWMLF